MQTRDTTRNNYLTATIPNPFYGLVPGNSTSIFTSTNIGRQSLLVAYPHEGKDIQFRAEALNAFNHPYFPAPVLTPTSATFGQIVASTQAAYPRRIQLTLKFLF